MRWISAQYASGPRSDRHPSAATGAGARTILGLDSDCRAQFQAKNSSGMLRRDIPQHGIYLRFAAMGFRHARLNYYPITLSSCGSNMYTLYFSANSIILGIVSFTNENDIHAIQCLLD